MSSDPTIFVSIASYRDPDLNNTILSLLQNARHPSRIFVGICLQNDPARDEEVIEHSNIRCIKIPYTQAKGPCYARYLCSTLYQGETYYMQIDSHCQFVPEWDLKCIEMMTELKKRSTKPVISYYPPDFGTTGIPVIEKAKFDERGILSLEAASLYDSIKDYIKSTFVAAGFIFAEGSFLKDIPYDSGLDYLFTGEEILLTLRFFTHGYDVYTPLQNILFHKYGREDKPKVWTDLASEWKDEKAVQFVKDTVNGKHPEYLGTKRHISDFFKSVDCPIPNDILENFVITKRPASNQCWSCDNTKVWWVVAGVVAVLSILLLVYQSK